MALVHRYVCIYPSGATSTPTTSTPSQGDSEVNYSAVYTSMLAMESSEQGDLTESGINNPDSTLLHVEIIDPDGDSDWSGAHDTNGFLWDGWTTDRAVDGSYVEVKSYGTARSSNGLYDTDAYVLDCNGLAMEIDNDFSAGAYLDISFIGVQFRSHTTGAFAILACKSASREKDVRFEKCYLRSEDDASLATLYSSLNDATNFTLRVKNCIIEGGQNGINVTALVAAYIYNCTIFSINGDGIETNGNNVYPVNCAVFNNVDDWQETCPSGYPNYCASDDDDIGINTIDISDGTQGDGCSPTCTELEDWHGAFTNPDASPPDVTIKDTDSCLYHAGENQTADSEVPSDDIVGETRPSGASAVSIGAFEYAAGGTEYQRAVAGTLDMTGAAARTLEAKRAVGGAI